MSLRTAFSGYIEGEGWCFSELAGNINPSISQSSCTHTCTNASGRGRRMEAGGVWVEQYVIP
jgi:hypothetical protein